MSTADAVPYTFIVVLMSVCRMSFCCNGVWHVLRKAAAKAGTGHISSHTFRYIHRVLGR